jgi:hypothetical protein
VRPWHGGIRSGSRSVFKTGVGMKHRLLSCLLMLAGCAVPPTITPTQKSRLPPAASVHAPLSTDEAYRRATAHLGRCLGGYGFRVKGTRAPGGTQGGITVYRAAGFDSGFLEVGQHQFMEVEISASPAGGSDIKIYDLTGRWGPFLRGLESYLAGNASRCRH